MQERRFNFRVNVPLRARLKGRDSEGNAFREEILLDDLSEGGLHVQLNRSVPEGSNVSVVVRLLTTIATHVPVLWLVVRGIVLRSEPQPNGTWGIAIELKGRKA